jgi:uncharacterized membrane protein YccC
VTKAGDALMSEKATSLHFRALDQRRRERRMTIGTAWTWARARLSSYRAQLRFCLRMTAAALLAFALAQVWNIPLHGLWAVLTAVVVTQMSVGGSLHATTQYVLGTIGGAIYAAAIGVLIPHTTPLALAGVLALTIAPLAFAAAVNPSFRSAPFTGAIVLLIGGQLGEGPVESALYRLLEVAIGGGVAVVVSLLVLPERAHALGRDAAAHILELLARLLLKLLAGFTQRLDVAETTRMQQEAGRALAAFQAIAAEAKSERTINLVAEPDPAPLARTLLRLRHDVVIVGRAAVAPLPEKFAERLGPLLARVADCTSKYLQESASALVSRGSPPPLKPMEDSLAAYNLEIAALRSEGLTRTLSMAGAEQLFTLGFALEQIHQHLVDLERCVQEWARPSPDGGDLLGR